jgi:DNA topoisomerase VI subunit B
MEFCTRRELVNQTGHDVYQWPLDACEEAEIAPVISVAVKDKSIIVEDNGTLGGRYIFRVSNVGSGSACLNSAN